MAFTPTRPPFQVYIKTYNHLKGPFTDRPWYKIEDNSIWLVVWPPIKQANQKIGNTFTTVI